MVGAQAIIADIVPPRERGRYMGLIGSVFAVASVAGPLLGGFLVDNLSWRWVFYVNMPIGAVAVADRRCCSCTCTRRHHQPPHRLRWARRCSTAGVASLILVTTWGGSEYAWGSTRIVGLGVAGVDAAGRVRVAGDERAAEPIIPLRLFRSSVFSVASAMGFMIGMAMFGAIMFIPLFLQLVYGASPTSSGLRMLPLMAGLLVASIASGRAISRIGRYQHVPDRRHRPLTVGMLLLSRLSVGTAPWMASALHARRRRRHRPGDAGARARRPERRAADRDRRRHLDRHLLPLDGRLASASPSSARSSRAG